MQRKKLFNVSGNDDITNRRMVGGNVTNLFNLNNVKYQWANKLYRLMMENFWIPEKVSLFDDKRAYDELTPAEQKAYDGILSFLVFLPSFKLYHFSLPFVHKNFAKKPKQIIPSKNERMANSLNCP